MSEHELEFIRLRAQIEVLEIEIGKERRRADAAEDVVRLAIQASRATMWGDEIMDMLFDAARAHLASHRSRFAQTIARTDRGEE